MMAQARCPSSGNLFILVWSRNCPVHHPEINPETVITIVGFAGAIMLLLNVVIIK